MCTQIGTSLFWIVNNTAIATYVLHDHTFPLPVSVNPPLDGVMVQVISVSANPNAVNTIDITSELTVNDVSVLNGASLQCEESRSGSNILTIQVDITFCKFPSIVVLW